MLKQVFQPPEIRLFHWLFFTVVGLKLLSGFSIAFAHPLYVFPTPYHATRTHATMTPFLASLLVFRLYYAWVSGDWRDILVWKRSDFREIRPWFRHFLYTEEQKPPRRKYSIAQRLLVTSWLLFMALLFLTGVTMLEFPVFSFLQGLFGAYGLARSLHYLVSVFLAATVLFHVYLVFSLPPWHLKAMISGKIRLHCSGGDKT